MKIAMISEHASPLAALGGVDAGGQNVHVAALSEALAKRGHRVTVYTRRDAAELPERVRVGRRLEVVHVDAGPARHVPKDELLPYMGELADGVARDWGQRPPDVVHGHFWMSGLAARDRIPRADAADVPRSGYRQAQAPGRRGHQPRGTPLAGTRGGPLCGPDHRHVFR